MILRKIWRSRAVSCAVSKAQGPTQSAHRDNFKWSALCALALLCSCATPPAAHATDQTAAYTWKPVRIGAGGFVTGFVTHPLDANVRYCRTDVGNAYRWNGSEWVPMIRRDGGNGLPYAFTRAPGQGGSEALAVDPNNTNIVYMAYAGYYSADQNNSGYASIGGNIYKSTNGGVSFTAGNLNVPMEPNNADRTNGERINVDPYNGSIVYYGSRKNGLWRSTDGGSTYNQVTANGAPGSTSNVMRVLFAKEGTTGNFGQNVGKTVYATNWYGSVYRSTDGGNSWSNISSGQALNGNAARATVDSNGILYVVQGGTKYVWKYSNNSWSVITTDLAYGGNAVDGFAVDPNNSQRMYASNGNGGLSRSLDGGATWTQTGFSPQFANTLGWAPQSENFYRSNAGISIDKAGTLWLAEGNEGMLKYNATDTEGWQGIKWTIESQGIEEFVTHDVIIPPGGNPVVAVEDATALYINNPDQFTAKQANLQDQLISNGIASG